MLQVSNVSKSYSTRVLFDGATFTVGNRERVGLVGRNGSGKSTLAKIILGLEQSDGGDITTPKGYKLGYLDQHISFTQPTLLMECVQYLPEEHEYDYYLAEKILFGLGFEQEDLDKDPNTFSGGYQLRINLTKCLLQEPNLLVLDEPTNYLDLPSLRWMRRFLKSYKGEVIIITHDREFMDSVITHTMGIHRNKVRKIPGQTQKYYDQLFMDEEIYEKTKANQDRKRAQLQRFVDRFKAKASKATQAQSVAKRIEKMGVMDELQAEQMLGFRFNYEDNPAKRLMRVEDLSFGFKEDEPLFQDLNFDVMREDRIAIIGKNGKGKTTLLNVLAHQLEQWTGTVQEHPQIKVGYYQQTNRKDLSPNSTIEEEIGKADALMEYGHVRAICGAMMFMGDDAKKKIKVLSGGEQGRVLLGKVLAKPQNILMLDEPTNHLDMESIEILTEEVKDFKGPCLFVTHNEKMLRSLATKIIVFSQGSAQVYNYTYEEFLEKVGWEDEVKKKKKKSGKGEERKAEKKEQAKERRQSTAEKKKQEELENEISDIEQLIADKTKEAESGEGDIGEVYKEIGQLQIKLTEKMSEWESINS